MDERTRCEDYAEFWPYRVKRESLGWRIDLYAVKATPEQAADALREIADWIITWGRRPSRG